jgi:hypothetical protein
MGNVFERQLRIHPLQIGGVDTRGRLCRPCLGPFGRRPGMAQHTRARRAKPFSTITSCTTTRRRAPARSAGLTEPAITRPSSRFQPGLRTGWTRIVSTPNGILCYNGQTGAGAVGWIQ